MTDPLRERCALAAHVAFVGTHGGPREAWENVADAVLEIVDDELGRLREENDNYRRSASDAAVERGAALAELQACRDALHAAWSERDRLRRIENAARAVTTQWERMLCCYSSNEESVALAELLDALAGRGAPEPAATPALIMANADYPLHGAMAVHLWETYAEVRTVEQALAAADAVDNALDQVNAVTAYRTDLARNQRPPDVRSGDVQAALKAWFRLAARDQLAWLDNHDRGEASFVADWLNRRAER